MKIRFYATLRRVIGSSEVELDLPDNDSIREMLETLFLVYPELRREMMDERGEIYQHVHIFVNGRDAPFLEGGLDAALQKDDLVGIFPAVGGG